MTQLFPVPDPDTEQRLRRALDVLERVRQIENRIPAKDSRFQKIRDAGCKEDYEQVVILLEQVVKDNNLRDQDTVMDLLRLMTTADISNPVDRIEQIIRR